MGDLRLGDQVFDESGQVCHVTHLSLVATPAKAYRIGFADGSSIDACSEHQWVTWTHAERKAFLRSPYEDITRFPNNWPAWRLKRLNGSWRMRTPRVTVDQARAFLAGGLSQRAAAVAVGLSRGVMLSLVQNEPPPVPVPRSDHTSPGPQVRTTEQIAETVTYGLRSDRNHCIPLCEPLDLPEADLPIPPYTLGAWLGDGTRCAGEITQHENDQPELIANLLADGFHCSQPPSDRQKVTVLGLRLLLRKANVFRNKHVPAMYLRASIGQRLSLLQGLMDTDGTVDAASQVSFSNGNTGLADAVYELVVSLGMKATRGTRSAALANLTDKFHWNQDSQLVTFTPTMQVFRLQRKAKLLRFDCGQLLRRHHRMVDSVVPIQPVPMRCITVDSPNSMYLVGRQMVPTHNTRLGAEDVGYYGVTRPNSRIAIVAPTFADARGTCIEGESGLLSILPPDQIRHWNRSIGELELVNNSKYFLYTAEKPNRLRGPQHHRSWCDELCSWKYAEETWDMLQFGLRLGKNPQNVVTTTPKPIKAIRDLIKDQYTHLTTGSTYDNKDNLPDNFYRKIVAKYEGTRLGRQELLAQLLDEIPGALWQRAWIEAHRVPIRDERDIDEFARSCTRITVNIDPAVTTPKLDSADKDDSDNDHDETGIVVTGYNGDNGRGCVLYDASCRESPHTWASIAVGLYYRFRADRIVGEVNNGGDLVEEVIRQVDPNVSYKKVNASRGKYVRAEPISALYEQGRISHVGLHEKLEDQMCTFTPEEVRKHSPDRADALVWGFTELFDGFGVFGVLAAAKRMNLSKVATVDNLIKPAIDMAKVNCPKCGNAAYSKVGASLRCAECGHSEYIGRPVAMIPQSRSNLTKGGYRA